MKELVEVIAKSLVESSGRSCRDGKAKRENDGDRTESRAFRYGKGHRQTGTDCESHPCCCKSRGIKRR